MTVEHARLTNAQKISPTAPTEPTDTARKKTISHLLAI